MNSDNFATETGIMAEENKNDDSKDTEHDNKQTIYVPCGAGQKESGYLEKVIYGELFGDRRNRVEPYEDDPPF